jgi:hypothetical protein
VTGEQRESQTQRYQIRVHGRLGQTIRSAFPALRARVDGGDTVLTGVLADQAAVYGVLAEAEALGLELIEVRRLPSDEPRSHRRETAPHAEPGAAGQPHTARRDPRR